MNSRYFVPAFGFAALGGLSILLIVIVVVRPWGGHDNAWATHLNLTDEPLDGYGRSIQTFVSPEGSAPISVWQRTGCGDEPGTGKVETGPLSVSLPACSDEPVVEWFAQGCAGCHGLTGEGGVVGPDLRESDPTEFADRVRFGAGGMPAYDVLDLSDEHLTVLAAYLDGVLGPRPTATPEPPPPEPTPSPTVEAVLPTPVATEIPVVVGTVEAMATPIAEPTVVLTTVPDSGDDELLAFGKLLFEETAGIAGCAECHGVSGRGDGPNSSNAPDVRGATRSQVRRALDDAFDMNDIELTGDELTAIAAYLETLAAE